jgi:fermentation-respiration switch protein FrsA (DUF1100 family)
MTLFYFPAIAFLLILIFLYIYLCPCRDMKRFNSMAFHPIRLEAGKEPLPALDKASVENVYFVSKSGKRLNGWLFRLPGASNVVLFNHGNAGNLIHRIEKIRILLSLGLSVFIYDYQGYGKSEGSPSLSGIIDDAQAAFDYLIQSQHYSAKQIIIYGESIGTGVAGHLSRLRPSGAVILESAFLSLETVAKEKLPVLNLYPDFLFPSPHLDNLAAVKKIHAPLLIISGEKDTLIPCAHGKLLFEKAMPPKKLSLLPNNGHNDIGLLEPETYRLALYQFFEQYKLVKAAPPMDTK